MGEAQSGITAISYLRFSHPDQAKGDSIRRQTAAAADWCERHGVALDTTTTLQDLGKSAFTGAHRRNPDRHALASFLKLVEDGKIPRGTYLLLENLDRLSREHIQPALLLALNLLQAGIRLVQLKPAEMVFDDKSEAMQVMMMVMELSRGHGESAIKSERIGQSWEQKRKAARENGKVMTGRLPAWVAQSDGKLYLLDGPTAAVRRIFNLAAHGYGHMAILQRLQAEGVRPIGRECRWTRSYVAKLLKDRRVLGELKPRRTDGVSEEAIVNYYPPAIAPEVFAAARQGAKERTLELNDGRLGRHTNLFTGMVWDARSHGSYFVTASFASRLKEGQKVWTRVLRNSSSIEGKDRSYTFPLATFEAAILSLLREIDAHSILNGDHGPDETLILAEELARVEAKIAELEDVLLKEDVATVVKVLKKLEEQKRDLAAQLATAREKAANPLSASWGEAQGILAVLESAPDPEDARIRLRSALRKMIESIWILVVPRGSDRLCAAQIWFAGGKAHRDYLVLHRAARANASKRVEGGWWARSLADTAKLGALDLRRRDHARRLEAALLAMDVERLMQ
jgi:DNA invertase Pin-like site-specific DNA recombinase